MTYGYITDQNPLADPEWKNLTLTRITCGECKNNPFEFVGDRRCKMKDDADESNRCPCHIVDDSYYSWVPDDDWFCANFEQKEDVRS